jgi:hypothetical protein
MGSAYQRSRTRTKSALMMASVTGSVMVNFEPMPCSDCTSMTPPKREMFVFTTSMPTPRPEVSVTDVVVLKPGAKMRL